RVKAVVLAIEPDKRRLSLGIKQLQPDVWESFFQTHHIGDVVHGKVLRVAAFGAFVEIAEGVEGLCHKSEAADENGQPLHLEPGLEHDFKIIKMNPEEKKVGLSIRAVGEEASRSEVEAYKQPVSSTSSTIGELISWKGAGNEKDSLRRVNVLTVRPRGGVFFNESPPGFVFEPTAPTLHLELSSCCSRIVR